MKVYQVNDWDLHFENDRSRERKNCSFVCVPNKQHGMGFSRVMAEPDGAAIYGIWHMIIGACSQQTHRNGWLTDDGEQAGSPWGADDMGIKFRRPVAEIQRALDFLCSPKVGWINCLENKELQPTPDVLPACSPPTPLEEKRREEKRKEGNNSPPSAFIKDVFDAWNTMAESVGIPKCLIVSDSRRRALQVRQRDKFFIENWNVAMDKVLKSTFCKGDNDRGWTATFDWFIKPENFTKIVEGKYDNREPYSKPKPTHIPDATMRVIQ